MLTMEGLRQAAQSLPPALRDDWYTQRSVIRARIAVARGRDRRIPHVSWDDPEFIAQCAVHLATLQQRVQQHINRFGGS